MVCTHCGEKDQEKFYKTRTNRERDLCIKCSRLYTSESKRFLKKQAVEYLGGKCILCGYSKSFFAIDFHHRDPTQKDMAISEMIKSCSYWEQLKEELDKCDIVCSNCHREIHHKEIQGFEFDHPTIFADRKRRSGRETQKQRLFSKCLCCQVSMENMSHIKRSYCSQECYLKHRKEQLDKRLPSTEELLSKDQTMKRNELAKYYGISRVTLVEWLKFRDIYTPKKRILSEKLCLNCNNKFHPKDNRHNFCSRRCYIESTHSHWPVKEELEEMVKQYSVQELASHYSVHRSTVMVWMSRYGLEN